MSDFEHPAVAKLDDGSLSLSFADDLYPVDAVYGAAFIFIKRFYVRLDRQGGKTEVVLSPKGGAAFEAADIAREFESEAIGLAWRRQLVDDSRELETAIMTRAFGATSGPAGLDDLLGAGAADAAFDDPLGIAMSWEDKHKKPAADAPAEPDAAAKKA